MKVGKIRILFCLLFFLLFSSFSLASITWFAGDITLSEPTVDTSAYVNCTTDQVFLGNGSCMTSSAFGDASAANGTWTEALAKTLFATIEWGYNQSTAVYEMYNDIWLMNYDNILMSNDSMMNESYAYNTTEAIQGLTNGTNMNFLNLDVTNNMTATGNITTGDYFYGQPIAGGIDGGIVWAAEIDGFGQLNLSHVSGLDITYPDLTVRVVSTPDGNEKYCNVAGDTIEVTDNAHVAYVLSAADCSLSFVPVSTFVAADISQVGNYPIFHSMSHDGDVEVHQGMPILNRNYIRSRILNLKTINLDVVSGMSLTEESLLNFTINSGEFVFVDQIVDTSIQNITNNATLEIFYRDGGTYMYDEYAGEFQTGLNITSCEDASENLVECSIPAKYRRYFIFITGYSNGDDNTELHQRLALDSINYVSIASCLDTETNPITYDLPDIYDFTAVPLFAYCLKGTDTDLSDGSVIDLRTVQTGQASGGIDTSVFLTKDGSRPLTANWAIGEFTIIGREFNATDWTNVSITSSQISDATWLTDYTNIAMLNETGDFLEPMNFSSYIDMGNFTICGDNEVMKMNGNDWNCEADAGGSFDDTAINATIDDINQSIAELNTSLILNSTAFITSNTTEANQQLLNGTNMNFLNLGISTTSPSTTLDVNGNTSISGNFEVSNSTKSMFFVDNSTGRVGIGTTNPSHTLNVVGGIGINNYLFHNDDADTNLEFVSNRAVFNIGGKVLWDLANTAQDFVKLGDGSDVDINFNDMAFLEGSSGNFGIGTTIPGSKLTVWNGDFNVSNAANQHFFVDNNTGYVGIGMVSPTSLLDVAGAINTNNNITAVAYNFTDGNVINSNDSCVFIVGSSIQLEVC